MDFLDFLWLRRYESNIRPQGYEPCELDCLVLDIWCQWVGSNHRPQRYECCALTSWATLANIRYNYGCGGMNRTYDLKVMSLASYHCSTPRYMVSILRRVIISNYEICQYVFVPYGSDYVYEFIWISYERGFRVYHYSLCFTLFVRWVSDVFHDTLAMPISMRGTAHSAHSGIIPYLGTYPRKMGLITGSYEPSSPLSGWWQTHSYRGARRTHRSGENQDKWYFYNCGLRILVPPWERGLGGFFHQTHRP